MLTLEGISMVLSKDNYSNLRGCFISEYLMRFAFFAINNNLRNFNVRIIEILLLYTIMKMKKDVGGDNLCYLCAI